MSLRHLRALIRKEINHIMRDRATFVVVMLTPVATLFLMAYALTVDIEHVPIAVLDLDRSSTSRAFVQQVTEGNLIPNLDEAWSEIAYFQVGDNPGRKEPTTGEINYLNVFKHIHDKGFTGIVGMDG